jgi:hypothetical protein
MSDDNSTRKPPKNDEFHKSIDEAVKHYEEKNQFRLNEKIPADEVLRRQKPRPALTWEECNPEDFLPGGAFWGGHKEISAEALAEWIEETQFELAETAEDLKRKNTELPDEE